MQENPSNENQAKRKITITVNQSTLQRLEDEGWLQSFSRSFMFEMALLAYLDRHKETEQA